MRITMLSFAMLTAVGCDYSGDFLFAGAIDGVRGVDHLDTLTPATIESDADIDGAAIFGEIGPTGTAAKGGVTFTFRGTGDHVCVFVDPEAVFWNQSVSTRTPTPQYAYPDNVFDDGDLDLYAGFATYYNGTPATEESGGEIGDFRVRYQDGLQEEVSIALSECVISSSIDDSGAHAGRGSPEYCTLRNTQPGVSYLVLMETWSTPLDDDRLGYGLLLAHGTCADMLNAVTASNDECVLRGETIDPSTGEAYPNSYEFEDHFCSRAPMGDYCEAERAAQRGNPNYCENQHCFCGDPADTPSGGSF